MELFRGVAMIFIGAVVSLVASAAPARQEITVSQIADAVRRTGMPATAERIVLLSHVTSETAEPLLKVESMQAVGSGDLRVRLNCVNRPECLPFYVLVKATGAVSQQAQASLQPVHPLNAPGPVQEKQQETTVAIRSGAPATLFIDQGRVHIRLAVVSLESGALGHVIRVVSKDHKTTYTAKVESTTTLRGQL